MLVAVPESEPLHYLMLGRSHIFHGLIGTVVSYESLDTYNVLGGREVGILCSDNPREIPKKISSGLCTDVTSLIKFCLEHEVDVFEPFVGYHRYKNIYELLIELNRKHLIVKARKECPLLFNTIMEDNEYIGYLCRRMKGGKEQWEETCKIVEQQDAEYRKLYHSL